ncbi:MAG TPA: hypothetical protein PK443_05420, partial [bacterium]|nr:hypothetical protein [bacterium]
MKTIKFSYMILTISSFILVFSSCGMFDQGKNSRNTNLIGSEGQVTVLCESSSDCDSDQVCNSNGVCVDNPILGAECETNSDCGNSILYTCKNGTCQKNVAQYQQAEAHQGLSLTKNIGDECSEDSECTVGI